MESPLFRCVAACAEFPNDNPLLYRERIGAPMVDAEVGVGVEVEVEVGVGVDAGSEVAVAAVVAVAEAESEADADAEAETGTDPGPPVLEADDDEDDIEIVDDLVIEDPVEEARSIAPPPQPASTPPPSEDPFDALVGVLEDVAREAGATDAAMQTLRKLLGRERMGADAPAEHSALKTAAAAWSAILRGESEDFSACGSYALDEWSSTLVAATLGEPARADGLRRELRRRGVAAFGLVVEAA